MIILFFLAIFVVCGLIAAGESYFERDWPRDTGKFALIAGLLLLGSLSAFGQNVRWDLPLLTTQAQGGNLMPVYAIPGALVSFYNEPAGTLANTYNSATSASACPTGAQVVLNGSAACVSSADPFGNMGAWFLPGQYMATITSSGRSYNYLFTIGAGSAGTLNCGSVTSGYYLIATSSSACGNGTIDFGQTESDQLSIIANQDASSGVTVAAPGATGGILLEALDGLSPGGSGEGITLVTGSSITLFGDQGLGLRSSNGIGIEGSSGTSGGIQLIQGSVPPTPTTNSVQLAAPASVPSSFTLVLPSTPPTDSTDYWGCTNASPSICSFSLPSSGGITQLTGEVTAGPGSGSQPANLSAVGSAGSCGDATHSCTLTFDAKGRETARTNVAINLSGAATSTNCLTATTCVGGSGGTYSASGGTYTNSSSQTVIETIGATLTGTSGTGGQYQMTSAVGGITGPSVEVANECNNSPGAALQLIVIPGASFTYTPTATSTCSPAGTWAVTTLIETVLQ